MVNGPRECFNINAALTLHPIEAGSMAEQNSTIEQEYRTITLTRGMVAIVDAADYAELAKHKWHAQSNNCGNWYANRSVKRCGKQFGVAMHRQIMGDAASGLHVDHKDGDGLNNRRLNLRVATNPQNHWNTGKPSSNTSGFKGVSFCKRKRKWAARITCNHKRKRLGFFSDINMAAAAYIEAAKQLHGEFAKW